MPFRICASTSLLLIINRTEKCDSVRAALNILETALEISFVQADFQGSQTHVH